MSKVTGKTPQMAEEVVKKAKSLAAAKGVDKASVEAGAGADASATKAAKKAPAKRAVRKAAAPEGAAKPARKTAKAADDSKGPAKARAGATGRRPGRPAKNANTDSVDFTDDDNGDAGVPLPGGKSLRHCLNHGMGDGIQRLRPRQRDDAGLAETFETDLVAAAEIHVPEISFAPAGNWMCYGRGDEASSSLSTGVRAQQQGHSRPACPWHGGFAAAITGRCDSFETGYHPAWKVRRPDGVDCAASLHGVLHDDAGQHGRAGAIARISAALSTGASSTVR